jgi:hypothetical protein
LRPSILCGQERVEARLYERLARAFSGAEFNGPNATVVFAGHQSMRIYGLLSLAALACVSFRGEAVSEGLAPPAGDTGPRAIQVRFEESRPLPRTWPEPAQLVLFGVGLNCIGVGLSKRKA